VYFSGVINTVGTGYKDFAEAQDQVYMPEAGGSLIIYHPGLTQTEGNPPTGYIEIAKRSRRDAQVVAWWRTSTGCAHQPRVDREEPP
jgi:hypothetical protein